jgi:hypothetical protein
MRVVVHGAIVNCHFASVAVNPSACVLHPLLVVSVLCDQKQKMVNQKKKRKNKIQKEKYVNLFVCANTNREVLAGMGSTTLLAVECTVDGDGGVEQKVLKLKSLNQIAIPAIKHCPTKKKKKKREQIAKYQFHDARIEQNFEKIDKQTTNQMSERSETLTSENDLRVASILSQPG